jgi:AcrR family transcriptional regulator
MSRSAARPKPEPEVSDGRRRRGQDNRARIVAAMIALVGEGEVAPRAEQVAARADVGLRTVFRHFQDMDSLYREMSKAIEAELRAIVEPPLKAADWPGRLRELIDRRARAFERIAPFRRAAEAFRHRSKFLGQDYARLVVTLRQVLTREAPAHVLADREAFEAMDLVMSFEAWSRLRREQGLSPEAAKAVIAKAVEMVTGCLGGGGSPVRPGLG